MAGRQKGIVTRYQLRAAGFSGTVIQRRIESGGLIPVHRGVYLVGHRAVHPLADETAAVLACRPRALLSFHTAARLWKLPAPPSDDIHITLVGRGRGPLNGVRLHSLTAIERNELRRHAGLPLTSPSLTLLDMAGALSREELNAAVNAARVQRLVTGAQLHATLAAHPLRTGAKSLRKLLASERGPQITHSRAERLASNVMRAHGIEPDATQHAVGPYRLDFYFEAERLAVEFDGRQFHDTPRRFVDDRRRTAYLAAQNIQVFPLTWRDLHGGQNEAMGRLRRALALRGRLFASASSPAAPPMPRAARRRRRR